MIITKFNDAELTLMTKKVDNHYNENFIEAENQTKYRTVRDLFLQVAEVITEEIEEYHKTQLLKADTIQEDALLQANYFVKYCYIEMYEFLHDVAEIDTQAIIEIKKHSGDSNLLSIAHHYTGEKNITWNFIGKISWEKYLSFDIEPVLNNFSDTFEEPIQYKFWNTPLKKYIFENVIDWHLSTLDSKQKKSLKAKITKLVDGCKWVTKYRKNESITIKQGNLQYIYNDKTTRALALARKKNSISVCEDEKKVNATLVNGIKFTLPDNITSTIGVPCTKLFYAVLSIFTSYNPQGTSEDKTQREIQIKIDDLAERLGYDIVPKKMPDEAAQKKENDRIKNNKKYARKTISNHCATLKNLNVEILSENNRTCFTSYFDFIEVPNFGNDYILFKFSERFADALTDKNKKTPIIQITPNLLKTSFRSDVSFEICLKLYEHASYSITSKRKGNESKLSIEKILHWTNLPEYDSLNGKSWKERIKKPFEDALTDLVATGLLKEWNYTNGKTQMTKQEVSKIRYFNDFKTLSIEFKLTNKPQKKLNDQ